MLKSNNKKTIISSFVGSFFALLALLIFLLLPTSDFANSINNSGSDALWVLAVSPVASLLSAGAFICAFIKRLNIWCNTISKPLVVGITTLFAGFGISNIVVYLAYFFSQYSLGFVAPYSGTVYEYLAVAVTVITIHKFLLSALVTIAIKRNTLD